MKSEGHRAVDTERGGGGGRRKRHKQQTLEWGRERQRQREAENTRPDPGHLLTI